MADTHQELGFTFAIGDDVFFVATVRECAAMNTGREDKRLWRDARPQRFTVCERIVQECYGGIQRHYDLRAIGPMGSMEVVVGISGGATSHGHYRAAENELVAATTDVASSVV